MNFSPQQAGFQLHELANLRLQDVQIQLYTMI